MSVAGTAGAPVPIAKAPTGIAGLDEITFGGLPAHRATLLCGGPGCAKTVLAMEILVRGAQQFGEPALFVSFEEPPQALAENFAPMGVDLPQLARDGHLQVLHIDSQEMTESGDFTLDGLFFRLEQALERTGARRVALDTTEVLFSQFDNQYRLRRELSRLFRWLQARGVTTIVTAESGGSGLTRSGIEAFVADCVILLDHRVDQQISIRRMRILKYRGSAHGVDEYPFLVRPEGISVVPITSAGLDYDVTTERVSTGVDDLDAMLGGQGYFRGASVLLSGTAGTGKSTLAAAFAARLSASGKRCLLLAFEESPDQLTRNMGSVGIDMEGPRAAGDLAIHAFRPSLRGLEEHLATVLALITELQPDGVVMDPISGFTRAANTMAVRSMLMRLLDQLKHQGTTSLFTSLTEASGADELSPVHVSSLMDTWIAVRQRSDGLARRRELRVIKSRGMAHDMHTRNFTISSGGITLAGAGEGSA